MINSLTVCNLRVSVGPLEDQGLAVGSVCALDWGCPLAARIGGGGDVSERCSDGEAGGKVCALMTPPGHKSRSRLELLPRPPVVCRSSLQVCARSGKIVELMCNLFASCVAAQR